MMLIEETSVPDSDMPVDAFKAHLRLGTGFSDGAVQDAVLASFLRAAMTAIEARTGKILLSREISWTLTAWRDPEGQALPIAPVTDIVELALIDGQGSETVIDAARYRLERDLQRPRVLPISGCLPTIPSSGEASVTFNAGFSTTFDLLPADLAQAVFLLAAYYYDNRADTPMRGDTMPYGVSVLIERYRAMRLTAGGRA